MVIQRLLEQSVFMLGQGLSINLFDMNRKLVDSAARPLLGSRLGNHATSGLVAMQRGPVAKSPSRRPRPLKSFSGRLVHHPAEGPCRQWPIPRASCAQYTAPSGKAGPEVSDLLTSLRFLDR